MRRPVSLLLGLSAVAALHPQLRLAARRPLALAVRMSSQEDLSRRQEDRPLVSSQEEEDLSKRTVVQLKEQAICRHSNLSPPATNPDLYPNPNSNPNPKQLRAAGLPVSGRKAELVDRLLSAGAPAQQR
eukprot:scaffold125837_cov63-Phaeocystis_antarctica.AAC.1